MSIKIKMASNPSPPNDAETKTIIDKLANFVARNGPEFEKMTMEKKQDDPKFAFLFGGEHNPYYRWKVDTERAEMSSSNGVTIHGKPLPTASIPQSRAPDSDTQFIEMLHSVKLKEQNDVRMGGASDPFELEFNKVVQPVMDTCSKESIASGKSWILSRSHSAEDCGRIAHYLMRRSLEYPGVEFNHKLHLVYLINDILYHCASKEGVDLRQAIETIIVQIFYNIISSDPNKVDELSKIVNIWEAQNCLNKDRIGQIMKILNFPTDKLPRPEPRPPPNQQPIPPPPPPPIGASAPSQPPPPPPWLQQQQQQFSNQPYNSWNNQQPQHYSSSWEQAPPSSIAPPTAHPPPPPWASGSQNPPWSRGPPPPPPPQPPSGPPPAPPSFQSSNEPTPLFSPSESIIPPPPPPPTDDTPTNIPSHSSSDIDPMPVTIDYNHKPVGAPPLLPPPPPHTDELPPTGIQVFDYQHRPVNWGDIPRPMMSNRPPFPFSSRNPAPPFFSQPPPPPHYHDIPPHMAPPPGPPPLPYFDLPAGLIVPLVPLHEHSYTSLKPHQVQLPAPQPPSERLLEAVEEFYYPPSEDKPRNEEGWEAKALLDFYNAKQKAKESMRHHSHHGRRSTRRKSRSASYSPVRKKRRGTSSSRSRSRSPRRRRRRSSRSPSTSSDSSRSRSRSPRHRHGDRRRRRRSSTGSSSRSSSRSLSPFTPTIEELEYRNRYSSSNKSNNEETLKDDNVGHQLLKRMGWEGAGLGAHGQGIQEPIKGGEVRDKQNQYAGVGVNMKDPFEQFRRNKSYTFNRRPPGSGSS